MPATLVNRNSARGGAAARRISRDRRHYRVRKHVAGTAERPRLVVTRSLRHIYAQVIDDTKGHKRAQAREVGKLVAERAKAAGIAAVVFDRGGNAYHGRVAALADAARAG